MTNFDQDLAKSIIVMTWGIGPSYRRRIKHNIQKAIDTQYDNILPYIILTDDPSDFYELQDRTKKIVDILNIHELREKYSPWSKDYEYISEEKNEFKYAEDYYKKFQAGKKFSYALHRFSLPKISELGYNRFLHCDCDTDIRYDKIISKEVTENEFWNEFNTPVNSMKGCNYEYVEPNNNPHSWTNAVIILGNILRYEMSKRYPEYKNHLQYLKINHTQTEGPFRYYHLHDSSLVLKYFLLWDEIAKLILTDSQLKLGLGGTYMIIDNVMYSVVNEILQIQQLNFEPKWHTVNIYIGDRYYFPRPYGYVVNGEQIDIQPAFTKEKFLEINKGLIENLKTRGELI